MRDSQRERVRDTDSKSWRERGGGGERAVQFFCKRAKDRSGLPQETVQTAYLIATFISRESSLCIWTIFHILIYCYLLHTIATPTPKTAGNNMPADLECTKEEEGEEQRRRKRTRERDTDRERDRERDTQTDTERETHLSQQVHTPCTVTVGDVLYDVLSFPAPDCHYDTCSGEKPELHNGSSDCVIIHTNTTVLVRKRGGDRIGRLKRKSLFSSSPLLLPLVIEFWWPVRESPDVQIPHVYTLISSVDAISLKRELFTTPSSWFADVSFPSTTRKVASLLTPLSHIPLNKDNSYNNRTNKEMWTQNSQEHYYAK